MYSLHQIEKIINGSLAGLKTEGIKYLSVDSRKIFFPTETLFFAIVTPQRDGHAYIKDAYEQGVRSFIVSSTIDVHTFSDAGFILVNDTLEALQQLTIYHRSLFRICVIGITGSNGKTVVKEWLNQLLDRDYNIVRSPKSYNSQIGVPLSVWQMNEDNNLAIFEAGISKPGEMEALQKVIQPTMGILTNIGTAHDEAFESQKQKLQEKLLLFKEAKKLICCYDNMLIKEEVEKLPVEKFSWGKNKHCDLQIQLIEKKYNDTVVHTVFKGEKYSFVVPFVDDASIENAVHCICVGKLLDIQSEVIAERLLQLHSVEMRLEWKKGIHNSYLINDSYSNDFSSLVIALNYLQQQRQTEKETVILSDIFQSGIAGSMLYLQVADLLSQRKVERIICIGPAISKYKQAFINKGIETKNFLSTDEFIQHFDTLQFKDEAILLKGARSFCFEKIVRLLEQQVHQTVLEINLTALANNLKQYRSLLQPATKMMVMVKAFGYGSGSSEVAKVLQFNKVDYLAVAYADEGVALRQSGVHLPIMVMNTDPTTFDVLDEYNLEPEIYSFNNILSFYNYCNTRGISSFPVHIKLDTGMHRLGFEIGEMDELATFLAQQNILKVRTIFTHLVASEDKEQDEFTQKQAVQFNDVCNFLEQKLSYSFIRHAVNTAAISRHPHLQMDMVRLGIGLYGVDSANHLALDVVSTLKSTIAQVKQLKAGETVGYNRKGIVTKDSLIATVCIGYADGYRRELGNGRSHMFLHGQLVPVIGNVCMDMTMIDVTGIGNVQPGDEVEIFGKNISIQYIAKKCNTIPYEIMTGISQRVKRVYFEE